MKEKIDIPILIRAPSLWIIVLFRQFVLPFPTDTSNQSQTKNRFLQGFRDI